MNKNKIIILSACMAIALIGIIAMQVNWILHDYHLKEQQFNQRVNDALTAVAIKLEKKEAFNIFSNSFVTINNDSIFSLFRERKMLDQEWQGLDSTTEDSIVNKLAPETSIRPTPPMEPPLPPDFYNQDDYNNDFIKMEIKYSGGRKITIRHNRQEITLDDSSKSNTHNAVKFLSLKADILEKQRAKIEAKINSWNKVMQNLAFEFISDEKTIEDRIKPFQLDSILKTELSNRGITTPYQFGVINVGENKIMSTNSPENKNALLKSRYKTDLFPNDLLAKPILLSLHFPQSLSYVLSTMWVMLISSSLFILVMLFGFSFTIYTIFRQKKLSDIKNDFINNMTHEFKTPIATISLATDAVNSPAVSKNTESVHRYMNIIKEENQRMHKHVENILQLALFDRKHINLNLVEFDIHEMIQKAIEQIKLQVEVKGGKIETNLNAAQYHLLGDYDFIFNSIINLLDNAIKYTPANPIISIATENIQNNIRLLISDNGIGMSREVQKNIFEKFYRAGTGNIHDVKGYGIGLSIVKAIAHAHNGEIKVLKSIKGVGTTMELLLPLNLHKAKRKSN
ncbi:MAG TPA: HAMP domain-containing sensor histidine kinase [Bacteroidia bacterium]|nr:HAMP domain-containing sensor histidine kinase [Bacteroidia bacterium]